MCFCKELIAFKDSCKPITCLVAKCLDMQANCKLSIQTLSGMLLFNTFRDAILLLKYYLIYLYILKTPLVSSSLSCRSHN